MDLREQIKRYLELREIGQTNSIFNGSEIQRNEFESLHRDLYELYMKVKLTKEYGNKFNSFDEWIDKEYKQLIEIDNLFEKVDNLLNPANSVNSELVNFGNLELEENSQQTRELDVHMKSFDNLGFNNQRVYDWHKSILETLDANGYIMSDFYFTKLNTDNNKLLQHITLKENTYNFLNSKRLINRGFCPITGEQINNSYNFNIFNRVVYLSATGLETCENIKRKEWNSNNKSSIDYDTFNKLRKGSSSSGCLVVLLLFILPLLLVSIFLIV